MKELITLEETFQITWLNNTELYGELVNKPGCQMSLECKTR